MDVIIPSFLSCPRGGGTVAPQLRRSTKEKSPMQGRLRSRDECTQGGSSFKRGKKRGQPMKEVHEPFGGTQG